MNTSKKAKAVAVVSFSIFGAFTVAALVVTFKWSGVAGGLLYVGGFLTADRFLTLAMRRMRP